MRLRPCRSLLYVALLSGSGAGICADNALAVEPLSLKPSWQLGAPQEAPCMAPLPSKPLALPQVVEIALCNNPQTREAWANARVEVAQLGVSEAAYLPELKFNASLGRSFPGEMRSSADLTFSYLLYDFGSRDASLQSARELLAAANATQDNTVQTVFLAAVQGYYQVQGSQAALEAAREAEQAAKASFAAAEARYLAGSATPADKLQARTSYSQATLSRITAEGNLNNAKGSLANLLGLDAHQPVLLTSSEPVDIPEYFDRDVAALIEEAKLRRPDLKAAEAQMKAAQANTEAVRATSKATLALTASTSHDRSGSFSANNTSVGINLSVPLFSGYAPTYRIRTAEAQVEARQAQLERLRLQVALDVWKAYQTLLTATQTLRATADLLDSASQAERVATGRYQAGVGSMLDVLNAQSALANARQQRVQSLYNWNINRAGLAQAMGVLERGLMPTLMGNSHHE